MRHSHFHIKNFKGITDVRLDFDTRPKGNIYTLVGLNESGKTTILEALNSQAHKLESLDPLDLPGYANHDPHELIPISKRSNFNDSISIEVGYELDTTDKAKLKNFIKTEYRLALHVDVSKFTVTRQYEFENSRLVEKNPRSLWSTIFQCTQLTKKGNPSKGKRSLIINARGPHQEKWQKIVAFLITLMPSVLYFPNFLFDFPDKIYLEDAPVDTEKHEFYRTILQDVLDALDEDMQLDKHVLERAKSTERFDKQALGSVLLKMGVHISKQVFTSWNNIFKRKIGDKEVVVSCDKDNSSSGWYIELKIKDNNELYAISERSLGFRWFFVFLLLTQYRGFRKSSNNDILFLFDEPASNLHPSAQTELLASFGGFPKNSSIIYTTHSHHMINPSWLEGTYVVKNEGIDYDSSNEDYVAHDTVVVIDRYRNFAAQHPSQTTYFQPILDVLSYKPTDLENVPNVLMVEGKNDFYTLKYFQQLLSPRTAPLNIMPGGGAGKLDDVIRLYLGWGRDFVTLLDSDAAGLKEKSRYEEMFGSIVKGRILTLADIDSAWQKKSLEFVISEDDRITLQKLAYPSTSKYNKTHFNRALQELFLNKQAATLSSETTTNVKRILDFCALKLGIELT